MTPADFRAAFAPAFDNTTLYPDSTIAFWTAAAGVVLNPLPWGDMLGLGTQLYVAHQLVVAARNNAAAAAGGIPGQVTGTQTEKHVDKVGASYNAQNITLADGGFWNLSTYGIQFLQLARLIGMQAISQQNTPGTTVGYPPALGGAFGIGGGYIQ